jgi:hypothetical protein
MNCNKLLLQIKNDKKNLKKSRYFIINHTLNNYIKEIRLLLEKSGFLFLPTFKNNTFLKKSLLLENLNIFIYSKKEFFTLKS